MFSKISRYRKVADVTAPDAKGRTLAAKDLRLLPDVTGTFRHTVEAGDRVDQLAYKYYSQPLQWWNICDANPDFLSPLELLDQDAIVTTRFPVTISGTPPWAAVIAALRALPGVEDVRVSEDIQLVSKQVVVAGQTITTLVEQPSRALLVTYNRLNVTPAQLASAIEAAGFEVAPFSEIGQLGQDITIPPKPTV
jgi:copper chaperone CopZ